MRAIKTVLMVAMLGGAGFWIGGGGGAAVPEAQAMPFNCVGQCAALYRACRRAGGDPASCRAEQEECKAACDAETCEPGDADCCGGYNQPPCPCIDGPCR